MLSLSLSLADYKTLLLISKALFVSTMWTVVYQQGVACVNPDFARWWQIQQKKGRGALNYVCGGKDLLSGRVPNLDGANPRPGSKSLSFHAQRGDFMASLEVKWLLNDAENASPSLWQARVCIRVLHQVMSEAVRGTFPKASALHQRHVSGGD